MMRQTTLGELISRLSNKIEDDEIFCKEEYDLVHEYCEKRNYEISQSDINTIRRIGLIDSFESWKESQKLYGITFDQAKKREDYSFTFHASEEFTEEFRSGHINSIRDNEEPFLGAAVLEIGYVDIELNVTTNEQAGIGHQDKKPLFGYFVCLKCGDHDCDWEPAGYIDSWEINIDWGAADWKEQLEKDMFNALNHYVAIHQLFYNSPNRNIDQIFTQEVSYENMIRDYLDIFDVNARIISRNDNRFLIADLQSFTTCQLEIIDGKIKAVQQINATCDCIENAKSAYDDDQEILKKIKKFEDTWYCGANLKVGQWVACCDYLPNEYGIEDETELNVTMNTGEITSLCWTNSPEEYFYDRTTDDVFSPYDEVIAWCKMPEPYKIKQI